MLWREIVQKVHDEDYPDVELSHMYADAGAMQLCRWPKQFDVIVTDNLFGDLLSDAAGDADWKPWHVALSYARPCYGKRASQGDV